MNQTSHKMFDPAMVPPNKTILPAFGAKDAVALNRPGGNDDTEVTAFVPYLPVLADNSSPRTHAHSWEVLFSTHISLKIVLPM